MPVESLSAWHAANSARWQRCRDAIAGSDAVKLSGDVHLPRPSGLKDAEFADYISRAVYFNASQRTHEAFVGMVMGRPPERQLPASLEEVAEYIDGAGSSLEDFARFALSEVLEVGGGLCLVDHPERPEGVVTAQQERRLGLRPLALWYPVESVMEYRTGIVGGSEEVTFLKLWESYTQAADEWTVEVKPQIRVYDMDEGEVRVRIFRKTAAGQWQQYSTGNPRGRSGAGLPYIPAVFFGPIRNAPGKPPLIDLIEVNLAHYRNSAGLEHALHFTGLPTAYASGVTEEEIGGGLRLGGSVGYAFEDASASIQYATYGADGLGALKAAMDDKQQLLAALGARMLTPETGAAMSGRSRAILRVGENSALAKIADSVSRSLVLVLQTMAEWMGVSGEIAYSLNTDYMPEDMDPASLTALVGAWQAGALTSPELFDRLKRGGVVRDDKDYGDHEAEIMSDEDQIPTAAPVGA